MESSHCLTQMEPVNNGRDVLVTVTMPCLEVGTIGGGTELHAQAAALGLLGVKGASPDRPGEHSAQLACCIAGTVLAGEVSLMAALASNHLMSAHMRLNRKKK